MDGVFTWQSAIRLHLLGFSLVLTPVLGFLVTGFFLRGVPRWRRFGSWLLLGSPLTLALAYLFFQTFSPYAPAGTGVAGLTERVLVVEVLAWYVALGWLAFRSGRDRSQRPDSTSRRSSMASSSTPAGGRRARSALTRL